MTTQDIPKDQQKVFIDRFLTEVEKLACQVLDKGTDYGSPGKLVQKVGDALVREIRQLAQGKVEKVPFDPESGPPKGELH